MLYTTYMPIQHVNHHGLNSNNNNTSSTTTNTRCLSPQLTTNCISDITFNGSNNVMPYFTYDNHLYHQQQQQQQNVMLSPTITKENLNMFYTKKKCNSNNSNNNIHVNSKNYIEKEKFLPSNNSIRPCAKYNLIDFYMGQSGYVNYIPPLQQIQVNHIQNYYQQIPYSLGNNRKF